MLLGHGYIGSVFAEEMTRRGIPFEHFNHANFPHPNQFKLVINACAFIPPRSVSRCDQFPSETIQGNLLMVSELAHGCALYGVPLMHLSTACLFDEERDYSELDSPQRGFNSYCGMYVGTKLMAEEAASRAKHYILRIRLPFDENDHHRNYLSKICQYPEVYDHVNSLSHRLDCVKAALDLWELKAPFGTYHVASEGSVSARECVAMMSNAGIIKHTPQFIPGPCKGTRLSITKLLSTGVKVRPVKEALQDSISNWKMALT